MRLKPKLRNKSGLLPVLYSSLPDPEKARVRKAMRKYNQRNPENPFFEPDQFYQWVYRAGRGS